MCEHETRKGWVVNSAMKSWTALNLGTSHFPVPGDVEDYPSFIIHSRLTIIIIINTCC